MNSILVQPQVAEVALSFSEVGYLLEDRSILSQASRASAGQDDYWATQPQIDLPAILRITHAQWQLIRRHRPVTPACFDLVETLNRSFAP